MSFCLRALLAAASIASFAVPVVFAPSAGAATAPNASTSHYLRSLSRTDINFDASFMENLGAEDAAAHSREVVMDIGAQTIRSPLSRTNRGVLLTNTDTRISYATLAGSLKHWMIGYHNSGTKLPVTLAIATNSDGDFASYSAPSKGADWANLVIDPVRAYAITHHYNIAVVGANDIEAGFAATLSQVQQWEAAFLANTSANLHYIGSADGCPTSAHVTHRTCNAPASHPTRFWTQQQYYNLTHNGTRIRVLPQVYVPGQATQWANIDETGGRGLLFAGSLSEEAACAQASTCESFDPSTAWLALNTALQRIGKSPGAVATDLDIR